MVASTYHLQGYFIFFLDYRGIDLKFAFLFCVTLFSALVDLFDVNGPEPR